MANRPTDGNSDLITVDGELYAPTIAALMPILTSAFGITSKTSFQNWRDAGCPGETANGWPVRKILAWGHKHDRGRAVPPPDSPSERDDVEEDAFYRQEVAMLIHSGDWRAALIRMLGRYLDCAASFEDLAAEIHGALGWHSRGWEEPVGGAVAIRFQGTRRIVWAGLSREFADAVVGLVNSGAAWLVSPSCLAFDEDCWRLDLPSQGKGDVWERWVLSIATDHRSEASGDAVETVTKHTIRLIDDRWTDAREDLLQSVCDFDALGLSTDAERREWLTQLADRVEEMQKKHGTKKR